jgi:hypothetical protein
MDNKAFTSQILLKTVGCLTKTSPKRNIKNVKEKYNKKATLITARLFSTLALFELYEVLYAYVNPANIKTIHSKLLEKESRVLLFFKINELIKRTPRKIELIIISFFNLK